MLNSELNLLTLNIVPAILYGLGCAAIAVKIYKTIWGKNEKV